MNVYFVNCFLAVTLAYIAGYWMASRAWKERIFAMLTQAPPRVPVTKDINLH
jgi:hypothetical protein